MRLEERLKELQDKYARFRSNSPNLLSPDAATGGQIPSPLSAPPKWSPQLKAEEVSPELSQSKRWELNGGRWVNPSAAQSNIVLTQAIAEEDTIMRDPVTSELLEKSVVRETDVICDDQGIENVTEITIVNVEVSDSLDADVPRTPTRTIYPGAYVASPGSNPPSPPKWPSIPGPPSRSTTIVDQALGGADLNFGASLPQRERGLTASTTSSSADAFGIVQNGTPSPIHSAVQKLISQSAVGTSGGAVVNDAILKLLAAGSQTLVSKSSANDSPTVDSTRGGALVQQSSDHCAQKQVLGRVQKLAEQAEDQLQQITASRSVTEQAYSKLQDQLQEIAAALQQLEQGSVVPGRSSLGASTLSSNARGDSLASSLAFDSVVSQTPIRSRKQISNPKSLFSPSAIVVLGFLILLMWSLWKALQYGNWDLAVGGTILGGVNLTASDGESKQGEASENFTQGSAKHPLRPVLVPAQIEADMKEALGRAQDEAQSERKSLKDKEASELARSKGLHASDNALKAQAYQIEKAALQGRKSRQEARQQASDLRYKAQALQNESQNVESQARDQYENGIMHVNETFTQEKNELQAWAQVEAGLAKMESTSTTVNSSSHHTQQSMYTHHDQVQDTVDAITNDADQSLNSTSSRSRLSQTIQLLESAVHSLLRSRRITSCSIIFVITLPCFSLWLCCHWRRTRIIDHDFHSASQVPLLHA